GLVGDRARADHPGGPALLQVEEEEDCRAVLVLPPEQLVHSPPWTEVPPAVGTVLLDQRLQEAPQVLRGRGFTDHASLDVGASYPLSQGRNVFRKGHPDPLPQGYSWKRNALYPR